MRFCNYYFGFCVDKVRNFGWRGQLACVAHCAKASVRVAGRTVSCDQSVLGVRDEQNTRFGEVNSNKFFFKIIFYYNTYTICTNPYKISKCTDSYI